MKFSNDQYHDATSRAHTKDLILINLDLGF